MAIRHAPGRKSSSNKNPPILSHEFVIQNHADIVSCFALVFVVGLMVQATSPLASVFIALQHSVTGSDPSAEKPTGEPFLYESGWKDLCAVFFYTLICIIVHAILQEYLLDKIAKKLNGQSKVRQNRLNESGQWVFFALVSFFWGAKVLTNDVTSWSWFSEDFPNHPMSFLLKLFYIIQAAYYIHMVPELYFQRVKSDEQLAKLVVPTVGLIVVAATYYFKFYRVGVLLFTLQFLGDSVAHAIALAEIFCKSECLAIAQKVGNFVFVAVRFAILVVGVQLLFFDIKTVPSLALLLVIYLIQGQQFVYFIKDYFQKRRERVPSKAKDSKKSKASEKSKSK